MTPALQLLLDFAERIAVRLDWPNVVFTIIDLKERLNLRWRK